MNTTNTRDGCPDCGSYNLSYSLITGDKWAETCRDCNYRNRYTRS